MLTILDIFQLVIVKTFSNVIVIKLVVRFQVEILVYLIITQLYSFLFHISYDYTTCE